MLETAVALLTPPARREDVIGDLHERYRSPLQYVADALQLLPAIVWSQIRRTTDLQRLTIESCGLYACFLSAVLWLEPPSDPAVLLRVLIPTAIMQSAFLVASAYAPGRLPLVSATIAAACVLAARAFLALRLGPCVFGCVGGLLVICASRSLLRPRHQPIHLEPGTGETSMSLQSISDRKRAFTNKLRRDNIVRLIAAAILAVMGVVAIISERAIDRATGGIILALALYILYQTYRHRAMREADSYRRLLERHRRDLLTMWSWYVMPFAAGLLLFALRLPLGNVDDPGLWARVAPFALLSVAWSVATVKLSRRAAGKLQSEIDELDR